MTGSKSRYMVVINHEEQYSLLPAGSRIPVGWKAVGKEGSRPEVLAYIEEVWTDMRPLDVRRAVEKLERQLLGGRGPLGHR